MPVFVEALAVEETARSKPSGLDVQKVRADFPILHQQIHGHPLVYLDNAASAQKPIPVIRAVEEYYKQHHANIHRGVHFLSETATKAYEDARRKVKEFINAASTSEIIFVRGTTEAINLVATSFGQARIKADDEIVLSTMEHHSNIVPWQLLCQATGAKLRIVPINESGEIIFEAFEKLINDRTRLVSLVHVSNSLGTINPVKDIISYARQHDVPVLLDGAQAIPHQPVDVQDLECDFYAFSGHKVFGPTGIGVLYGRERLLEEMPPYQGGGEMIKSVTFEGTTYNDLPHKFEAGTPSIAGAIGLGAALDYVDAVGYAGIQRHEKELLEYATECLWAIEDLKIIGTAKQKASVLSFVLGDIHPHDVGTVLNQNGIAVRTGHHCTQPVMQRFRVPATTRASFAFYNTKEEVDALVRGLQSVIKMFN